MKWIVIFFIIIIGMTVVEFFPQMTTFLSCYDSYDQANKKINLQRQSQNLRDEVVCQIRYDAIFLLRDCISNSRGKIIDQIRNYAISQEQIILNFFRPGYSYYTQIVHGYNEQCTDYPVYRIEE